MPKMSIVHDYDWLEIDGETGGFKIEISNKLINNVLGNVLSLTFHLKDEEVSHICSMLKREGNHD